MTDCRRTPGLIDRVVEGSVTPDDRLHAATCASCGPVLARAARFDDELRRAARGLVTDELPREILDPRLADHVPPVSPRFARAPGFGPALAVVAILLLAVAFAIGPAGSPGPSPSDGGSLGLTARPSPESLPPTVGPSKGPIWPLRTTGEIVVSVTELGYRCGAGRPLETIGPETGFAVAESSVCVAPDGGAYTAAIVVMVDKAYKVVAIGLKADIVGEDTAAAREAVAGALAKLTLYAIADKTGAQAAADLVFAKVPLLDAADPQVSGPSGATKLVIELVKPGSYHVLIEPLD